MTDKKPVPPALAEFSLEQLAEAGEQAAIDLTVQNVEILRAEVAKRDARIVELEAAVEYNRAPDDAEFGPGHPVFELAKENDGLRAALKAQQPSAGVVLPERKPDINRSFCGTNAEWYGNAAHNACLDEVARLNPTHAGSGVVLPELFEMRPFQTVEQGSTNYKAGFNRAVRKVAELNVDHTNMALPPRKPRLPIDWSDRGTELADDAQFAGWNACLDEVARLNPCRAQAVQVNHDSDCSTNNHGVPELLGQCDCSASKDK